MQAGAVNIKLMADILDLQEKMRRVPGIVGGAMDSIKSSVDVAKTALAGLGIIGAAVAFAGLVHGAIESADALNKLAQRTGISTENLSQLQYAAKLADVSNDSLSTGIKKLSQSMAAAAAGDKEKVAQFRALGIEATTTNGVLKSSDEVLLEIADTFAKSRDGAGKTAAAVALLGKAGDEMIPLLNGGSQAIREMMKEADKLGLTIGSDFAAASEEFNDNLSRMQISGQKLAVTFAGNFVEGLGKAMKAMADASIEGGRLSGVMAGLSAFIFGDAQHQANVAFVGDMDKLMAAESALAKARANNNEKEVTRLTNLVSIRRAALDVSQRERKAIEDAADKSKAASDALAKAHASGPDIRVPGAASSAAAAESDYDKLIKRIKERISLSAEELKAGRALTEDEKFAIKVHEDVANAKQKLTAVERQRIEVLLEQSAASANALDIQRGLEKAAEQAAKERLDQLKKERDGIDSYMQAQAEATASSLKSVKDRVIGLQDEELALAMVREKNISLAEAIEQLALARLQEKQAGFFDGSEGYIALQKEIDARKELLGLVKAKAVRDEWTGIWASIDGTAHDVFVNIFEGGQSAFKKLGNVLKGSLLDLLYQMTVKKWIFNISASITGGASGIASAVSGGGDLMGGLSNASSLYSTYTGITEGTGVLGGALSYGTTALGLGASSGSAAVIAAGTQASAAAAAAGASAAEAAAAAGVASGTAATGTVAGGITGALSAIPVYGWIAIAVLAAFAAFGGKGGGPKQTSVYGAGTDYLLENDPQAVSGGLAKATVEGIENSFKTIATTLGDGLSDIKAGVLTSTDPQGDANTILSVESYLNGQRVYSRNDRLGGVENVGRNDEDLAKAIQEESIRAVYAGLQASDIAQQMKDFLGGIDVDAATGDALQLRINEVLQVKQLSKVYEGLDSNFSRLFASSTAASQALITTFGGIDKLTESLGSYVQNFYSQEEITSMTMAGLTTALDALGYALPTTRDGFRDLVTAQDLTTTAGAAAAKTLLDLQATFASVVPASESAADALARVTTALKAAAADRLDVATNNANNAYVALERFEAARRSVLEESIADIQSVFDTVKSNAAALYGSVASTSAMQAAQGQAFISQALATAQSTGYLPDGAALSDAITAARGGVENGVYASKADADFARLKLAGSLSQLESVSGGQLDVAQAQLDNLEGLVENARQQLDAALGIDNSIKDQTTAQGQFQAAIMALLGERSAQGLPTGTPSAGGGTGVVTVGGAGVASGVTGRYADRYATGGYGMIENWVDDAERVSRLDSISQFINSTFDGSPESIKAIADAAAQYGVSQKDIAAASGYFESDIQKLFAGVGIPAFASGGYHDGGWAMVGEQGPEVAYFGQSARIYNASQTSSLMGGNTERLESLVEGLTAEVQRLQGLAVAGNKNTRQTADTLDQVSQGGTAVRTRVVSA